MDGFEAEVGDDPGRQCVERARYDQAATGFDERFEGCAGGHGVSCRLVYSRGLPLDDIDARTPKQLQG